MQGLPATSAAGRRVEGPGPCRLFLGAPGVGSVVQSLRVGADTWIGLLRVDRLTYMSAHRPIQTDGSVTPYAYNPDNPNGSTFQPYEIASRFHPFHHLPFSPHVQCEWERSFGGGIRRDTRK